VFTGIIEELGTVQSIVKGANSAKIRLHAPFIVSDVKLGDSIAVNGICLTVVAFDSATFTAEAMAETLAKTNLGDLEPGEKVNLERALRLSDRLGGHLVSGHVDGVGTITRQSKHDIAIVTEINYPSPLGKYMVPKGSIAIDGISLTIVEVNTKAFTVSLIPHTRGITTLGFKKVGDKVNLEVDVIAKYLEKLTMKEKEEQNSQPGGISLSFLAEQGFI
jgi:riboflavin synthase